MPIMNAQTVAPVTLEAAAEAAMFCRTFVTIGTSLTVHPAAGLVEAAHRHGARVVIVNDAATPFDDLADHVIRDPISSVLPKLVSST